MNKVPTFWAGDSYFWLKYLLFPTFWTIPTAWRPAIGDQPFPFPFIKKMAIQRSTNYHHFAHQYLCNVQLLMDSFCLDIYYYCQRRICTPYCCTIHFLTGSNIMEITDVWILKWWSYLPEQDIFLKKIFFILNTWVATK